MLLALRNSPQGPLPTSPNHLVIAARSFIGSLLLPAKNEMKRLFTPRDGLLPLPSYAEDLLQPCPSGWIEEQDCDKFVLSSSIGAVGRDDRRALVGALTDAQPGIFSIRKNNNLRIEPSIAKAACTADIGLVAACGGVRAPTRRAQLPLLHRVTLSLA